MAGVVVTGHGNFATGLESSLKLIYGASSHIKFVDFVEGESTDTLKAELNAAFDELKEDGSILVLSDLLGGSPFKMAVESKLERQDVKIEVAAGTSFALLLACATMIEMFDDARDLADAAIAEGKDAMTLFELETEVEETTDEDGI